MRIVFWGDSLTEGFPGSSALAALRRQLPEHDLINRGQGGDTVKSLLRRMQRTPMDPELDLAFLWVGVNDVLVKTAWRFRLIKRMRRQLWARNHREFAGDYRCLLDELGGHVPQIISVSPFLIGEDFDNEWNRELEAASALIARISSEYGRVRYLDLRAAVKPLLMARPVTSYRPRSLRLVLWNTLVHGSVQGIRNISADRGFHLTIDGVHLNQQGAELVAGLFREAIIAAEPPGISADIDRV